MNNRAYTLELGELLSSIPEEKRRVFLLSFVERSKNPVVGFGLAVYLGYFGIDRFYRGQVFLGLLKLVTLGGFGIWAFVDLFITAGGIRDSNLAIAREIKSSLA